VSQDLRPSPAGNQEFLDDFHQVLSPNLALGKLLCPLPSGESKFVMPVKTGIQVRLRFNLKDRLDSGWSLS
jgi:hypothetical protein